MSWHKNILTPRATAVETACTVCGRAMWLPKSKVASYKRCSKLCVRVAQTAAAVARVRPCETCGEAFTPRPTQLANGIGRFCCRACIPANHLTAPENLALAQQRRREAQAAGLIDWKTGADHHSWKGGSEVAIKRRTESGKMAAGLRAYRAKNPHKTREWRLRRRCGKVMPRLPWGTIPRIGAAQKWRCAICKVSVRATYHLDHIMPLARGGEHEPRNLQLLCPPCNLRKSAKDPIDFMQERGMLL